MALFKFQNYSAIKSAQNNPRVKATIDIKNGSFFKIKNNYDVNGDGSLFYKEASVPFEDADDVKNNDVWVSFNIVDKPEVLNYSDFEVKIGEYIRAFNLTRMSGEIVELSADAVSDAFSSVTTGDILIPRSKADVSDVTKLKKAGAGDTGYPVAFEVIDKTLFGSFTVDGSGSSRGYELKITNIPSGE